MTELARSPAARLVALVMLLTLAVVAVYDFPLVRPGPQFTPWVDGWAQGTCFVAAAVLCVQRAARGGRDAWLWRLVAAALVARAFGFVTYLAYVRWLEPVPYPSISDAGWLVTAVLVLVAMLQLTRTRFAALPLGALLDALTGALATAAVALVLLQGTLATLVESPGGTAVLWVNLAYPLFAVAQLVVLVTVLAGYGWRPPAPIWWLAVGIGGSAVVDATFVVQVTAGTFRPGSWLTPLTLAATAAIALAGWQSDTERRRRSHDLLPGIVAPTVFSLVCLGVLLLATARSTMTAAVVAAALGLAVAVLRTALTFRVVKQAAEHRREARTDDLTGLANRRYLHQMLTRRLHQRSRRHPLSLLVLDLDGFKLVNDTLGHHNGDELLRLAAVRLQDALRSHDLLARLGGDEFAVLLDGAGEELAGTVAERLTATLRRPFPVGGRQLQVPGSVGIAVFPADGTDAGELLQHADLAMYEAKVARTGHSRYRPEPHQANVARLESIDRLRHAIETGEIVVHYQPVVRLDDGVVTGVEALCRWRHPEHGLLAPGTFLQLAESGGLMGLLTDHVLRRAVEQTADLPGGPVDVAVNLSVTNLLDPEFPDRIRDVLRSTGTPGTRLQLELTEDLLMADPSRARSVFAKLGDEGIRLLVDDYGTGYSSLAYLRDLREVTGLKIDRSFVKDLTEDPRSAAIVESTLQLASSLGLTVVAEGVETQAVAHALRDLGCDHAQGYYFARPAPAHELSLDSVMLGGELDERR